MGDGREEVTRESAVVADDVARRLREAVPEAFEDGQLDVDRLRAALGDFADSGPDRYMFNWAGKTDAIRLLQTPSRATFIPVPEESIDFPESPNVFVEADNLEALKLMYRSYFGRIKMIYIDVPYNTGTDFVYADNFSDPLATYLQLTGQMDEAGNLLTSTPEARGRFHSAWLSMMYPRLYIARQLLSDDGVIFVSIDDREVANLRLLMNEIFGEENFVGTFVWQSKKGGGSDSATAVTDHEYVLCYARSVNQPILSRTEVEAEPLDKEDEKGPYRRGRELNKWGANSRREDRPTMYFAIPGPGGEEVYPIRNDGVEGCWRFGRKRMHQFVTEGNAEFVKRPDGKFRVYEKIRTTDPRSKPFRTWLTDVGTTADGSKALKELFEDRKVYDFPKPVPLIKHLVRIGTTGDEDLVLDFFAGSCTTAQAVMELNAEEGTHKKFICVQIPESTPEDSEARKMGFENIAEIGKERIRRAIKKLAEEFDGADGLSFKVFRMQASHYKSWGGSTSEDADEYVEQLEAFTDPLTDDWSPEGLTWEVIIKEGVGFDAIIRPAEADVKNELVQIIDPDTGHSFVICLDEVLEEDIARKLELSTEDIFICLDRALSDDLAANLALQCHLKVI